MTGHDSIIDWEREEWRGHDAEPPTWADLDPPTCLCGRELHDHWDGFSGPIECDIERCPCDRYRAA